MADSRGPKDTWAGTVTSLEAIIQQIDNDDIDASPEGRAFLAGAVVGLRAKAQPADDGRGAEG